MGLFQSKKEPKKQSLPTDDQAEAVEIFDESYREELRAEARDYFKKVLDENSVLFKHNLDKTIAEVSVELKDYLKTQLDATLAEVDKSISKQLEARLLEYDRVTKDAQDLAVQSLNRNAQVLHDRYQQLSQSLQQTIASQEATMISVFEENKGRMMTVQSAQDSTLKTLKETAETTRQQAQQLSENLQSSIADQQARLKTVYDENMTRVDETKKAQEASLKALNDSSSALLEKHAELSNLLDKSVADQKAMLTKQINDNMARIVEHYLIGALGEESDLKSQLPSILEQMEKSKQAMVDDMAL